MMKVSMSKKDKLIPELRFQNYSDSWYKNELVSFTQVNPSSQSLPEKFIYIDLESVGEGRLLKKEMISKSNSPSRAQRVLQKDDILFQTVRPYQMNNYHFHFNQGDYVASTGYAQLRTENSSGFLYQHLHTYNFVKKVLLRCTGTSYPAINSSDLKKIKILYPSLPEQQKIASFLSTVDKKINLLESKIEHLEQYKKGVVQKIFNQEIRFKPVPNETSGNENGKSFPEWKKKKLASLLKFYDGTHQTPKYVDQGIPFYSVEHLTSNNFSKTKFISEEVYEKENKRVKLEKGDILMTRIGDIGTSRLIDWNVKASFYVSVALLKQNDSYNSSYLNQFIKSSIFQRDLWKRTIHVAFPKKINLGEIGNCVVLTPCLKEQAKIANFLSSLDKKIDLHKTQLDKMKTWKKGLLQKMFL